MTKEKRILTIIAEISQPEANWLWETMLPGIEINGVKVFAMADGDALEDLKALEERLDDFTY